MKWDADSPVSEEVWHPGNATLVMCTLQAAATAPLGSISLSVVSADTSSGAPAHSLPYWPSLSPERWSRAEGHGESVTSSCNLPPLVCQLFLWGWYGGGGYGKEEGWEAPSHRAAAESEFRGYPRGPQGESIPIFQELKLSHREGILSGLASVTL